MEKIIGYQYEDHIFGDTIPCWIVSQTGRKKYKAQYVLMSCYEEVALTEKEAKVRFPDCFNKQLTENRTAKSPATKQKQTTDCPF